MRVLVMLCVFWATANIAIAKPGEGPQRRRVVVSSSTIVIYESTHFPPGGAALPERANPSLDAIAVTLIGNPDLTRIEVRGHCDASEKGDLARLSRARAEAVIVYLVGKGVDPARLAPRGLGANEPARAVKGKDQRRLNRRVEFVILERRP